MPAIRYCTPEWLQTSVDAYQANPKFHQELQRLSIKVCFKVRRNPDWGIDEDILFGAFVEKGELKKMGFFNPDEAREQAEVILAATPQEWKRILRKESKFVTDFMLGKINLEQGSTVKVMGVAPYANTFVDALTQSELQFPDEMTPEELSAYRAYMQEFRADLGV